MSKEITVIYDGDCDFCKNCLIWVQRKLAVNAIAYQVGDLNRYGLTTDQCAKQVYVIKGKKKYGGVKAVTFLLRKRKNWIMYLLLKISAPLADMGYRWVAQNRDSNLVRMLNKLVIKLNKR